MRWPSRSRRARARGSSGCRRWTRPAETAGRREPEPGDNVPQWARLQHELHELGLSVEPVLVTDASGALLPETRDVLRTIARHGLILATAPRPGRHLRARRRSGRGRRRDGRDHPPREFTCQNFSIEDQVLLAERGCLLERCLTTPQSGKTTWEHVFDGVRAVGAERTMFSSDLGNPHYPVRLRTVSRCGPTAFSMRLIEYT